MSELSSIAVSILGTVIAALTISIILGIVWMRKAIADQKSEHDLMAQRMSYNESKLDKIEATHDTQYNELLKKIDQTLAVLTDIKLAFSEVRIKNEENERRINKIERQA
jgi:ABC-type transport system involved in cytochrome c biogenesis permease subunit